MATANTIIGRALRLLKVVAAGETIEAGIAADALTVLNNMGQRWLASGLLAAWTDATSVASTLDPAASQSEALASNLAVLLAPEFEMEPPPSMVAMAADGLKLLWRDRLVADSGRTAGDIIKRALRVLSNTGALPDSVSFPGALEALNAMGNRWLANGLIASWTDAALLTDAVSTSASQDETVIANLAARLAPEYGIAPDALAPAAAQGVADLWRDRLVPSGVTRTAGDLIHRSLRLLSPSKFPDSVNVSGALTAMNAIGQRWLESGLVAAWVDVSAVGSAVSTSAAADDVLVVALAAKLAPEYGVDGSGFVPDTTVLWRDRLTGSGVAAGTAEDVILRALRLMPTPENLPDVVALTATLGTLNAMLAEWHEAGIGLPDYSFAALATPLASDIGDREAIAYQLALRLAPEYGVSLPMEVAAVARQAMFRLRSRYFQADGPIPATYY